MNNDIKLGGKIRNINLSAFDIVRENFEKNFNIELKNKEIINELKTGINFGWNDEKDHLALKVEMSIIRKMNYDEDKEKIQAKLSLVLLNLYEGEDIEYLINVLDNENEKYDTEEYEIINYLLGLAYPKIKKHIEYIFKNSNMNIKLPETLKVGD